MSTAIQVIPEQRLPVVVDLMETAINPVAVVKQVQLVQQIMKEVMQDGEHYGVIPGTGSRKCSCGKRANCPDCGGTGEMPPKKTLLKPGAEKLCYVFRLAPQFDIVKAVEDEKLIIFDIRCLLIHTPTGTVMGSGMGSCSSREEKYGWRKGGRECPECHKDGSIIKGKPEYAPKDRQNRRLEGFEKGGFVCFKKKGGCGATFQDEDPAIVNQSVERVPTENIWEQHNTMLKMAQKRALIAAVLVTTACSDIFTQDLDDKLPGEGESPTTANAGPQPPATTASATQGRSTPAPAPRDRPECWPLSAPPPAKAHPHFSGDEPALKIKPLILLLDAYNRILALAGESEAAKFEETYFYFEEKAGQGMCYEWSGLLESTNEKFILKVCEKAVPRAKARAQALEEAHREVDALKNQPVSLLPQTNNSTQSQDEMLDPGPPSRWEK